MTCIVGVVDSGRIYMGGDSAGVSGYHVRIRQDPKVFRKGPFLMGFTTSFRMGQLLQYTFKPPTQGTESDFEYMVNTFVAEVRNCFNIGGYITNSGGRESGGTFMVGYNKQLYTVDTDFQVGQGTDGFEAIGCGYVEALASLRSTQDSWMEPRMRVEVALDTSAYFNAGVRAPFNLVEM